MEDLLQYNFFLGLYCDNNLTQAPVSVKQNRVILRSVKRLISIVYFCHILQNEPGIILNTQ
jgi:hypothetical protein